MKPAAELIFRAIEEASEASRNALVQREGFAVLSAYLDRIVALLKESLLAAAPRSSNSEEDGETLIAAVESLSSEVHAAGALALECGVRSRVYLLVNCRRVAKRLEFAASGIGRALALLPLHSIDLPSSVAEEARQLSNEMAAAEFLAPASEEDILSRIESGIQDRNFDRSYANGLLFSIADAIGVPRDRASLKKVFDDLKHEIEDAKLRNGVAEAIQLEQIGVLLGRADAAMSLKEKELKYYCKRNSLGSQPLEPLESFYCPITQEVMEDPVETSSGQTFERKAIGKWFAEGNTLCPLTMVALDIKILRPNISLRRSIEEWKERNTIIAISTIKFMLNSSNDQEILDCLFQLHDLCEESCSNREYVVLENYLRILVGFLGWKNLEIRNQCLTVLCILSKDGTEIKEKIVDVDNAIEYVVRSLARRSEERKLAVALLSELSNHDTICSHIGKVQGCILLLVTISNGENSQAAIGARALLERLSFIDDNVIQMAKANYFKPMLKRLDSGSDHVKRVILISLADMELTDHSKSTLLKVDALPSLLNLVSHSDVDIQTASVKVLRNLSSLQQNGLQMIKEGALQPLLNLLRLHNSSSPDVREQVAATIMNIAVSCSAMEENQCFACLECEDDIFWLFSLINLSRINVKRSIIRTFYYLCRVTSAKNIRVKLRECSGIQVLFPYCENSDHEVRANAIKLLSCLTGDEDVDTMSVEFLSQRSLESLLSVIRTSDDEEEICAALCIISNLPTRCAQVTQWLVDANAIQTITGFLKTANEKARNANLLMENAARAICRFTLPNNHETQKKAAEAGLIPLLVWLLESGSSLTKQHAAISLAQFSESSNELSKPVEWRGTIFLCCSPPPELGCLVHLGICSVEASFCLLEANAVKPLTGLLQDVDHDVCEAGLWALSTLTEGEMLQGGARALYEANAIGSIIRLLSSKSTELQEKALVVLERVFRFQECKKSFGAAAQMPLIDITQGGNAALRAAAARVLAHLNVLHEQSSYF